MKNTRTFFIAVSAILLLLPAAASAQPYEITHYVIASGGGSDSTGTSSLRTFVVDGTVGQNLAGSTSAGIGGGGYSIVQNGFWAADFLAPTAALVSISGRVISFDGRPAPRVRVLITAPDGSIRSTNSSSFGLYRIEGLDAGQTYVITAGSKGFDFISIVVTLNEDVSGFDLTALPN